VQLVLLAVEVSEDERVLGGGEGYHHLRSADRQCAADGEDGAGQLRAATGCRGGDGTQPSRPRRAGLDVRLDARGGQAHAVSLSFSAARRRTGMARGLTARSASPAISAPLVRIRNRGACSGSSTGRPAGAVEAAAAANACLTRRSSSD